jgi:hypothetical protein
MAKANQPELITVIDSFRAVLARPDEQMRRAWHLHVNNHWKRHRYRDAYRFTHRLTPLNTSKPSQTP